MYVQCTKYHVRSTRYDGNKVEIDFATLREIGSNST
jgi:hypothetical protein